ncbi:MAG: CarD family transcriptional regulator [bacterium]
MFQVEQDVFYPLYGIVRIDSIEDTGFSGKKEQFYVFNTKGSKIMAPVERSQELGIRAIKTEKELQEFVDHLKQSVVLTGSTSWAERYANYLSLMKKGDPFSIPDIIKDLYWQNKEGNISSAKEKEVWNRLYHNLLEEVAYIQKSNRSLANKFISKVIWETK